MLLLKSRGKRFVGDNISFYQEGDLVFIGTNLPHTIYSPAEFVGKNTRHEAILIQFTSNVAGLNFKDAPEFQAIYHLFKESARGLQITGKTREVVAKKMIKMNSLDGIERLIQLLIILDILGKADEHHKKTLSSIEFVHNLQPNQQSRIDRICTYLNQNYKQNIRLEDAAAVAAMSTTAFCRFFKRSTGKTFVDFVNELRVGHACRLLIESDLTIAEICYDVGFNNVSNFNRRFWERHHLCPKDYRREFTTQA
ncbi:helix-turn-helix domain-containing protein [candidate division KSB1 bacterium]|nr:helix-turn-helix transcriptional regulator [candidate division KSB1 bacterium]NIS27521.1 helix-turn-helix transcriptional regulator [candidate division KSB1 bacterium]NIU28239.1 helix-turn-helix transcriptional regulator [candidate division KSB1 bacterium]NIU91124.1 helix-turn-helix domain-containing protein [candidate division KSB1 bacterium]NIV96920.1 helix-turn-helix domain-containing protein [candidate division KSB1 bacterium]